MNIDILVGLRLESCRLSRGSYSFELDGQKDGRYYNFSIETSYYLSFSEKKKDVCENYSKYMWSLFEMKLIEVTLDEEKGHVIFKFKNDKKIIICGDSPLIDNLLMVRNIKSGEWFMVG